MLKNFSMILLFIVSIGASATSLTIKEATVTRLQVYETTGDSVNVWIYLNGNPRVGPNPVDSQFTCELWTNSNAVYSAALSAFMSGKKVDVTYVDRGQGTYWCKVHHFSLTGS